MMLFKRNRSKGQIEKKMEEEEPEADKGYTTERLEGYEKASFFFKDKGESEHEERVEEAPGEIDTLEISNELRSVLKEFVGLLPKIDERKEHLERHVHQEEEKIREIEDLIPKLEEKKRNLQDDMKRKQEEMSRIDEIKLILHMV